MDGNTFGENSAKTQQLNPEQLQSLFKKLSSDELQEVQEIFRKCTSEIILTRGVPLTALILGSLYVARKNLPAKYHFGPKGWPFYAVMGIGGLTASTMFSMGSCKERVLPKIETLWRKYELDVQPRNTYEQLRMQNRQNINPSQQSLSSSQVVGSYDGSYQQNPMRRTNVPPMGSLGGSSNSPPSLSDRPRHGLEEEVSYMSGTPVNSDFYKAKGPPPTFGQRPPHPTKTNQYGDEGFS